MSMPMPQGCRPFMTDESAMGKKFDDVRIRLTDRSRLFFRAAVSDAGMVRFFQLTVDVIILLCAKIHEFSPLFCALAGAAVGMSFQDAPIKSELPF